MATNIAPLNPDHNKATVLAAFSCKRLNLAEMAARCKQGLCYNCNEKYIFSRRCKKLFSIEILPSNDDDEGDEMGTTLALSVEEPAISLHALTSIRAHNASTMKIHVELGGTTFTALLDSSSTHNFVDEAIVANVGLSRQVQPGLRVAVANGDHVTSHGKCLDVKVLIGGEAFDIDFYALPLGGYDMVLGVQWLGTLGPILRDFTRQTNRTVVGLSCTNKTLYPGSIVSRKHGVDPQGISWYL